MQREKQVGLGLFVRYGLRVGPAAAVQENRSKAERPYAAKRCNTTNASREVRGRKKLGSREGDGEERSRSRS